jgi:uncharacterized 2Fe-2S/4Fe-4S cluster protein (DUF4445 family)
MCYKVLISYDNSNMNRDVKAGQNIKDILADSRIFLDSPCGGNGTCGKCKVICSGSLSEITENEKSLLTTAEIEQGIRLACFTNIDGDATVTLPKTDDAQILKGFSAEVEFKQHFKSFSVDLTTPTLANPINDETNILQATNSKFITNNALKKLSEITKLQRNNIFALKNEDTIVDVSTKPIPVYGMAVDIGTTTVVAYFYDLITGELIDTESGINEQRAFGADVISRISACIEQENGLNDLQRTIINELNGFINDFCTKANTNISNIYFATIAGNTTMLHLIAGINPTNIANAPFIPVSLFGKNFSAASLGLNLNVDASVYLVRCISSYIGGDITAGMLACGKACGADATDKTTLYIDIGTNGEMTLIHNGKITCCSTAAGPAFEGAQIKFGTGGVSGAISSIHLQDNEIIIKTINNMPAIGICGSGLIDAIAVMLKLEVIDETGRICDNDEIPDMAISKRIVEIDDSNAFILDIESGIYITQRDVREVQLAKSAIASGIACLLHDTNIAVTDVQKLILAGGFGSHMNSDSACEIGLLPKELTDKIEVVGNAAGNGAAQLLLSQESFARLDDIAASCENIELSGHPYFQDQYIENMMF